MKKHTKSYRTSQYVHLLQHPLRYALLMAGLWCIGIFASISILVPQQVNAQSDDSIPGGNVSNPTIRAVDIAKPAVVRIRTDVRGHLTAIFLRQLMYPFHNKLMAIIHLHLRAPGRLLVRKAMF